MQSRSTSIGSSGLTAPFRDDRVAGVAGRQIPWPDAPWHEVQRLQRQFGDTPRVFTADDPDEIVFSNAASSFLRSVWEREPFTLPAVEDLEWARRVVSAGWTIVYEPQAEVYHSHAESARAQARRLIDIGRVSVGEDAPRRNGGRFAKPAGLFFATPVRSSSLRSPFTARLRTSPTSFESPATTFSISRAPAPRPSVGEKTLGRARSKSPETCRDASNIAYWMPLIVCTL